jgi:hypothetical protein
MNAAQCDFENLGFAAPMIPTNDNLYTTLSQNFIRYANCADIYDLPSRVKALLSIDDFLLNYSLERRFIDNFVNQEDESFSPAKYPQSEGLAKKSYRGIDSIECAHAHITVDNLHVRNKVKDYMSIFKIQRLRLPKEKQAERRKIQNREAQRRYRERQTLGYKTKPHAEFPQA